MSIADFETISKLGDGAFSSVFKVMRKSDGHQYALKKVKLGALKQKEKENALNEVRILASVYHPNIIAYKEAFIDEPTNTLCIVMELAESGDLLKKINNHKSARTFFPENEVWMTLVHVTQGLKVLHDSKILHRDLKCANIFISKEGVMKLGDLNVSKVNKRGLVYTQTGTPYYASPEVWKDQPYNSSSDIWSLGCVIYEMAALVPPFTASDMQGLYKKIIRGAYPNIPSQYSSDLSNVIRTLLQVNPTLRPSCDKILDMPPVQRHINVQYAPNPQAADLLGTIKFEPGFKNMKQKLPGPNYDSRNRGLSAHSNRPKVEETPVSRVASARGRDPAPQVDEPKVPRYPEPPRYEPYSRPQVQDYKPQTKDSSRYQNRPDIQEIISRKNSDPNVRKPIQPKPELFNIPESKGYSPYVAPYRPDKYSQLYNDGNKPISKNPSRENIYPAKPPSRENIYQNKPSSRENLNYLNTPAKPLNQYPAPKPQSRENPSAYQYINKPPSRDSKNVPPYLSPQVPSQRDKVPIYAPPSSNRIGAYGGIKDNKPPPSYAPPADYRSPAAYMPSREVPSSRENKNLYIPSRDAPPSREGKNQPYIPSRETPLSREGRVPSREDPNKNLRGIGALVLQSPKQMVPKNISSPQDRNQPVRAYIQPEKRQQKINPVWWG
jgi:serine/threonine protein kinase